MPSDNALPLPPAELRQQAIAAELRRRNPSLYPNTEAGGHQAMEDAALIMDVEARIAEKPCGSAAAPQPGTVRISCAMSGERETLVVKPIGRCGVSFSCGEDASVIVDGDNLVRIRSIIDAQIAGAAATQQRGGS